MINLMRMPLYSRKISPRNLCNRRTGGRHIRSGPYEEDKNLFSLLESKAKSSSPKPSHHSGTPPRLHYSLVIFCSSDKTSSATGILCTRYDAPEQILSRVTTPYFLFHTGLTLDGTTKFTLVRGEIIVD